MSLKTPVPLVKAMKKILSLLAIVALTGCAGVSVTDAIANAEAEIKAAQNKDMLWSNTENLLAQAKTAQAAGDNKKAVELAQKAAQEAKLAQQQAQANATAQPYYPR
jgi:hypothetical protein